MAANGHKRFPYSHLLNSVISYQLLLNRKRSMVFCSIGSVEEHTKCLQKLDLQKGAKYCAKNMAAGGWKKFPDYTRKC